MTGRLVGKVAFVTGGCSGIGLAMVETFFAEGAQVVVGDVQDEKGALLEQRFPDAVRFAHCDVSSEADVAASISLAVDSFGGLDICCNNAGNGGPPEAIEAISVEKWDSGMALLLRGPMLGIKYAIPAMRARGGGAIINTSSIAGIHGGLASAAYAVAKAGVIQLSRKAAMECAADGIRVNTICPGFIATPIFGEAMGLPRETGDAMALEMDQAFTAVQPLPYAGRAQDLAQAALYLAADSGRYVTGTEIVVDGGTLLKPGLDVTSTAPGSIFAAMEGARRKVMGE